MAARTTVASTPPQSTVLLLKKFEEAFGERRDVATGSQGVRVEEIAPGEEEHEQPGSYDRRHRQRRRPRNGTCATPRPRRRKRRRTARRG